MADKNSNKTYVIGHINPDTDSVASAMGYAWLLQEEQAGEFLAARAGKLNPQTKWVLDRLGLEPPAYLHDASPRFSAISHRYDTITTDSPMREAWAIANRTGGVAPIVNDDGTPYGMVSVMSLFHFFLETVGSHPRQEQMKIAELMDRPATEACDTDAPKFQSRSRIKDSLSLIMREERTNFWVVDEHGSYVGVCRQRDALHPPRLQVVLVDHNEPGQALGALNEADLVEVLDHHRLGNPPTNRPIKFTIDLVGSTCTLVAERIVEAGLGAPSSLAGLLLAGIMSDTLVLTSPTTTKRDHDAVRRLSRWAFITGSKLQGETVESFGKQVLEAGAGLTSRPPEEIVNADFKVYDSGGMHFGISQVEVVNMAELGEYQDSLMQAMIQLRNQKSLDFVMLMVTDVVRRRSRLLVTSAIPSLDGLPYPKLDNQSYDAKGVVSRKLQLLPAMLAAISG